MHSSAMPSAVVRTAPSQARRKGLCTTTCIAAPGEGVTDPLVLQSVSNRDCFTLEDDYMPHTTTYSQVWMSRWTGSSAPVTGLQPGSFWQIVDHTTCQLLGRVQLVDRVSNSDSHDQHHFIKAGQAQFHRQSSYPHSKASQVDSSYPPSD